MRLPSLLEPRNVLLFALTAEAATGAAAVLAPGVVAQLVLGAEVSGAGVSFGRLLGAALLALAIACWPGARAPRREPLYGMLAFNALAAAYLACLGALQAAGPLLWPAVIEHGLVALLLVNSNLEKP